MTVDPLDLVGTTIAAKYLIERVVGEGAYAVVYKANHLIWKRPVAIKVFKGLAAFSATERATLVESFVKEGALLADLSERTPVLCQARDVGTLTTGSGLNAPYMVLEWLEGRTLASVLADEHARSMPPRTLDEVVALLEPIAEALALAHRKGVAHRDLKPANIFVLGDPRGACQVKIIDFGIAKVIQDAQKMSGASDRGGSTTAFSPSYGSPEQFSRAHGPTGPWTDVFALALIMSEVLTSREALPPGSVAQMGYASTDKQVRPTPRTLGATVTDEVERVFKKALAVSPQERYQSVGELWNELRGAMHVGSLRRVAPGGGRASVPGAAPFADPSARPSAPAPLRDAAFPIAPPSAPHSHQPGLRTNAEAPQVNIRARLAIAAALVLVGLAGAGALVAFRPPTPPLLATDAGAEAASAMPTPPPARACPKGTLEIAPGSFYMGSDDREDFDFEKPAHKVTFAAPLCMDVFEVTVKDYKAASDTGAVHAAGETNDWKGITPAERQAFDPLCNVRAPEDRGNHPINCVTWEMATAFCASRKMRLPTEAEWEYAARGPDGRKYPWGDELPNASLLNACGKECMAWGKKNKLDPTGVGAAMYAEDDGFPTTAPVGSFPSGKSRYGIQDVVGNVWEWVADAYAPYTADDRTDPHGPDAGDERVIRGGAWNGAMAAWVRPTFRYHDNPHKRSHGIGFRCASTPGR